MKTSILEALQEAGPEGMTVAELSEELGVLKPRVQSWFSSTGKHLPELRKVGVGRWRFVKSRS